MKNMLSSHRIISVFSVPVTPAPRCHHWPLLLVFFSGLVLISLPLLQLRSGAKEENKPSECTYIIICFRMHVI